MLIAALATIPFLAALGVAMLALYATLGDSSDRILAALRGDEARLSLEGGHRVRLEGASREQGADDDRDDQRDDERPRDAEKQPRAKLHGTTLYPAPRTVRISRGRPSLRRS